MITLICIASLASLVHCGLITHDLGGNNGPSKATSYQNFHMEHFHAVPTYIRKEYKHLLEHPIPVGKSSSRLEVHHGDKHDLGYAIVDAHNNAQGSGGHEDAAFNAYEGGHAEENFGGHEETSSGGHVNANLGGHEASGHLVTQAIFNTGLDHGASGGYEVHDQNQELLQHQAAQIAQNHGAVQVQAVALSHGGASLGHGAVSLSHGGAVDHSAIALDPYQAAATSGHHQGYGAALHVQNSLAKHEHSS